MSIQIEKAFIEKNIIPKLVELKRADVIKIIDAILAVFVLVFKNYKKQEMFDRGIIWGLECFEFFFGRRC